MIEYRNVHKSYGAVHVLNGINLTINLSLIHISEPTRPY